jgi:hypothetical protein
MARQVDPWTGGLRPAQRALSKAPREAARAAGLGHVWGASGEFLYAAYPSMWRNAMRVSTSSNIKTLAMDDALWDVLGMRGRGRRGHGRHVPPDRPDVGGGCPSHSSLRRGAGAGCAVSCQVDLSHRCHD